MTTRLGTWIQQHTNNVLCIFLCLQEWQSPKLQKHLLARPPGLPLPLPQTHLWLSLQQQVACVGC
jgi:hypothetical protein